MSEDGCEARWAWYLSKICSSVRASCRWTVFTISSPAPHMKKKAPLAPSLSLAGAGQVSQVRSITHLLLLGGLRDEPQVFLLVDAAELSQKAKRQWTKVAELVFGVDVEHHFQRRRRQRQRPSGSATCTRRDGLRGLGLLSSSSRHCEPSVRVEELLVQDRVAVDARDAVDEVVQTAAAPRRVPTQMREVHTAAFMLLRRRRRRRRMRVVLVVSGWATGGVAHDGIHAVFPGDVGAQHGPHEAADQVSTRISEPAPPAATAAMMMMKAQTQQTARAALRARISWMKERKKNRQRETQRESKREKGDRDR